MTNENAENCVFYSNDSTPTESFSTELLDVITAALEDPDNHLDSIVKEALKRMDGTSITFAIPGTVIYNRSGYSYQRRSRTYPSGRAIPGS